MKIMQKMKAAIAIDPPITPTMVAETSCWFSQRTLESPIVITVGPPTSNAMGTDQMRYHRNGHNPRIM